MNAIGIRLMTPLGRRNGLPIEGEMGYASNPFPNLFHEIIRSVDDERGSPIDDLDVIDLCLALPHETGPHGDPENDREHHDDQDLDPLQLFTPPQMILCRENS
jgi:hypothetical protein